MLTKFMYFLEMLHCIRSLISIIVLVIGIILIFIWKFKSKKTSLLICSVIAIVIPCIVIAHGVYLRGGTGTDVKLSQQELMDFSEYILENDRYLNTKDFLPNNKKDYFEEETKQYEYEDGQTVNYDFVNQRVIYQPNSAIYYWLETYENEQDAQKAFAEMTDNLAYIGNENYLLFADQSRRSTFFDYEQGEHHVAELDIYILHKNYVISFHESTERKTPKLYSLIKEHQLFDSDYKLTTLVAVE